MYEFITKLKYLFCTFLFLWELKARTSSYRGCDGSKEVLGGFSGIIASGDFLYLADNLCVNKVNS